MEGLSETTKGREGEKKQNQRQGKIKKQKQKENKKLKKGRERVKKQKENKKANKRNGPTLMGRWGLGEVVSVEHHRHVYLLKRLSMVYMPMLCKMFTSHHPR